MLITGVFYFMVSVGIGMYMSIAQNYVLKPVHVHLNMLGWVSLAIGGLIYLHFPKTATSIWGKIHYWTHMIGVPAMMFGIGVCQHSCRISLFLQINNPNPRNISSNALRLFSC